METKQLIKKAIRELGYNPNRDVTVKENRCGYSWSFTVTIRKPDVNYKAVEEAAKNYKSIGWDHYANEPLMGGNTYISVEIKDEVKEIWIEKYIDKVNAAIEKLKTAGENRGISIDERFTIFYDNNGFDYKVWDDVIDCWMRWHFRDPRHIALEMYIGYQTPINKLKKEA